MTDNAGVDAHEALLWLSFGGMGLFMAGRMGGSWLMTYLRPEKLLAICGLGAATKQASSYLIMSIVGGAVAPLCMGMIADSSSMSLGFVVPLICFVVILGYAVAYKKIQSK